jgi:hypothetical protein
MDLLQVPQVVLWHIVGLLLLRINLKFGLKPASFAAWG